MLRPRRNEPCPCRSGRKFKQCCLPAWEADAARRNRLFETQASVHNRLFDYVERTFGLPFIDQALREFLGYPDDPPNPATVVDLETMFVPWLLCGYVADPHDDLTKRDWPTEPVGRHWLSGPGADAGEAERRWIEAACRSPLSAFIVDRVEPGHALEIHDAFTRGSSNRIWFRS
jgi:hypothetical protein